MSDERIFYNAVAIAAESNYAFLQKMIRKFRNYRNAWEHQHKESFTRLAEPETIEQFCKRRKAIDPQKEWEKIAACGAQLIFPEDKDYPPLLKEASSPAERPPALYVLGRIPEGNAIAVVGTRMASEYGKRACNHIVSELGRNGVVITSGLALGIDETAHQSCIEAGGKTVAVIGSGFNNIYPTKNKTLAARIVAAGGAIVSEYPLDAAPLRHHFPERNRIISGLSRGVLVIEAPEKSGSLITARYALEQNRDVFAVPGPISSKNFSGSHRLIKEGAAVVTAAEDILEEYGWEKTVRTNLNITFESDAQERIFKTLAAAHESLAVDAIVAAANLDAKTVNRELTLLMIRGIIKDVGGRFYIA
ncbi:MAG: DNA protecting protein DprA [Parcubacteria group bacterium RIFCSPLOWO2_01_FULL_48_18]|nr:MAG: DNA protecting protein DprA [Parcubacteria group bacterium RIFCSPLOWO2_01_FULL_48_18]OHB24433.1 MAG: DNA protecting protein DprA [Parcubacteria group bacterium RIFCSPHIGHO2_02_FULL_48_10b]